MTENFLNEIRKINNLDRAIIRSIVLEKEK